LLNASSSKATASTSKSIPRQAFDKISKSTSPVAFGSKIYLSTKALIKDLAALG